MTYALGRAAMVDWSDRGPARPPVHAEWSAQERAPEPRGPRRPPAGGPALTRLVERTALTGHVVVAGCVDDDVVEATVRQAARVTVLVRGSVDAEHLAQRFPTATVICGDLADLGEQTFDSAVLLDGLDRISTVETPPDTWPERLDAIRSRVGGALLLTVPNPLSPAALSRVPGDRAADSDADWAAADRSAPTTSADALASLPASVALSAYGPWSRPTLLIAEGCARSGSGAAALSLAHSTTGGPVDERSALRLAADAGRLDAHAPAWVLVPGPSPAPPAGLPDGILFEEAFLDAAAGLDAGPARALLQAAADALRQTPALPHSLVVGPDGRCTALPLDVPASADPAVAFCIALADRIEQLGARRPWPSSADRVELASLLLGAAGHEVPLAVIEAALPPQPAPTPDAARTVVERGAAVRERERAQVDLIAVLETRAVNAEDRAEKRAEELRTARARLARAREELEALRGSRSFRVGRALTAPVRRLRGRGD